MDWENAKIGDTYQESQVNDTGDIISITMVITDIKGGNGEPMIIYSQPLTLSE